MKHKSMLAVIGLVMLMVLSFVSSETTAQDARLAIEVITQEGKTLYLPVSAPTDKHFLFALAQVSDTVAIKVVPIMQGHKVKIGLSLVTEGLNDAKTCAEKFDLPGEDMGSHLAERNQTTTTHKGDVSITFKVVDRRPDERIRAKPAQPLERVFSFAVAQDSEVEGGCTCGRCQEGKETLVCCPNPGKCIGCAGCGDVCCF